MDSRQKHWCMNVGWHAHSTVVPAAVKPSQCTPKNTQQPAEKMCNKNTAEESNLCFTKTDCGHQTHKLIPATASPSLAHCCSVCWASMKAVDIAVQCTKLMANFSMQIAVIVPNCILKLIGPDCCSAASSWAATLSAAAELLQAAGCCQQPPQHVSLPQHNTLLVKHCW